jgi:FkbM family methyltransferase
VQFTKETFRKRLVGQLQLPNLPETAIPLAPENRNPRSLLAIEDEREFLQAAYRQILGRDGDPAGLDGYLGALQRGIPRRAVLGKIARSKEAQSKPGPAVSFWAAHGNGERGRLSSFFLKARAKLLSIPNGILQRVLWSRFDALDNRMTFLFEELSQKIDQSLWTVSAKFDDYFSHLNDVQKLAQEENARLHEAAAAQLDGLTTRMAVLEAAVQTTGPPETLQQLSLHLGSVVGKMNTIQRREIRVVQVDDFILGLPAEEWRLAAYLRFRGIPEPGLVRFFQSLIRPGMTIVDVGANFGIFTLYAARSLQWNGRVHSFEPAPSTHELLRENVQVNGFLEANLVQFHETAVTDSEGIAKLTTFADNSGHNTLFWQNAGAEFVVVKTTRLDTALQEEERVNVVKIDAEGAELKILRGMKRTIERNPEIHILIEFAPIHLARAQVTPEDFLKVVAELDLEVRIVDDLTGAIREVSDQELRMTYSSNLYLCRRNRGSQSEVR